MRRLVAPAVLALAASACNSRGAVQPSPTETPQQVIARQKRDIEVLKEREATLQAQVKALRDQVAVAQDLRGQYAEAAVQVEKVFIGRYSHVAEFDENRPGPDGVKVYLYLYDRDNEKIKRAGRIELKVFDLAGERKLGHWIFDPPHAMTHFKRGLLLDCFVFQLPWQEDPGDARKVQLHWQFQSLDGRTFTGTGELEFLTRPTP